VAPIAVVFSYQYPGKYALNVLAGALESRPELDEVELHFPRDLEGLERKTRDAIERGCRTVVAWSSYSPSFPRTVEELRTLRAALGDRFLAITGGVHAIGETADALRAGFDLVCTGEGERPLIDLLLRLREGRDPLEALGFARRVDSKEVRTPRGEPVQLDEFPAFAAKHRLIGAIEITRGCIYACRFCQTPFASKAKFRHRSVDNIAHWIRVIRATGRRDVRFISPTSLSYGATGEAPNLAAVEELLAKSREAAGPDGRLYFGTFPSEVRPEHVTAQALALLKRYVDNDNLIIGGQSGSERVLEQSRRGHGVEAIVRAAQIAVECGFVPNVDFILGLPGEGPSEIAQTVELMKRLAELGAKVHGHTFMPLPGTPFRDQPPGKVDEVTRLELERLASKQMLYGQWKQQELMAAEIAVRRARSAE
jgi:B12-binding domain/radical SAM domain protein